MSVEVWVAHDGEPHQAHIQSAFQAYMRDLEFHTDHTVKAGIDFYNYRNHGDGLPFYINKGGDPNGLIKILYAVIIMQRSRAGLAMISVIYYIHMMLHLMAYSIPHVCCRDVLWHLSMQSVWLAGARHV